MNKLKKLFNATLIVLALSLMPFEAAEASWLYNGVWVSNICRYQANMGFYFVYPTYDAQPVGTYCIYRDVYGNSYPGIVTAD
ncbi:MAG TPA: hypothetical protein VFM18_15230 [Methanosarcina sp.]|nr:hypothetical protein [Methanosarcina sp.]